jgi:translation initiation factor 2B subunit (eIF-2B alpha/beta/delta family)/8-oxo-dGTP pyrophosphatase MutT (NUDIX family)
LEHKSIVTAFLVADARILLLRRSQKVRTHRGKWSAVSGYLEGNEDPLERAQIEIREELNLGPERVRLAKAGDVLRAYDEPTDTVWAIHPFLFDTRSKVITLDWENTEYRWILPSELRSYEAVPKLEETYDRVRCNSQTASYVLTKVHREIDALAQDMVHGASTLGRNALLLLAQTAEAADKAATTEEIFCNLLSAASKIRKAQPAMANVWNLVGMLMFLASEKRASSSAPDFRKSIRSFAERIAEQSIAASEDASRNAAAALPESGAVLTHSYSTTVLRALELGMKGRKGFAVYATESYPGMEGKSLAKTLVGLGVPVTLTADSAIGSIIPNVDLVLVGADSVLTDGSLLHKVGTKNIADIAIKRKIPFYSVCESIKFSAANFLGEPVQGSTDLFDATPSQNVSQYITESGVFAPNEVEGVIRQMLKEIYP